jgi:hypothetical protein
MLKLHQVTSDPGWWAHLEQFPDHLTFHTEEWIRFIADTQRATPVFAEVRDGSSVVGYFHSLMIRRFGLNILGSPFPGWATMYMGFNLLPGVPRWEALQALEQFAFRDLGCMYVEVADRLFTPEDAIRSGFEQRCYNSYEHDLTQSEEILFRGMTKNYRRCIRKADRSGVVIEEAEGDDTFVSEYYDQLTEVFCKQSLTPTYSIERVRRLVEYLHPTGHLALFRARDIEGRCIATGISHGMNNFAQGWGSASSRESLHFYPNQALQWHVLRYWRSRGIGCFDWGGGGKYKEQYGCRKVTVIRLCKSRIRLLSKLRDHAQYLVRQQFRVRGWWMNFTLSMVISFLSMVVNFYFYGREFE